MPNTEPVRVTIFNQTYSLVASEDPGRIEQLAHRIDDLMSSIAARGGNIDSTRAAVLACLHLADQLDTLEGELASLKHKVEHKAREFSVLLDEAIGTDARYLAQASVAEKVFRRSETCATCSQKILSCFRSVPKVPTFD